MSDEGIGVEGDDVEELEAFELDDEGDLGAPGQGAGGPGGAGPGVGGRSYGPAEVRRGDVASGETRPLEFLHAVEMDVTVELGRAKLTVRDLLEIQTGSIVELDRSAGSPVDILVNGVMIARGEVVVVDDEFAVRITEVLDSAGIRSARS